MIFIILRRILQAIMVLLLVALVSCIIFRYVGKPVDNILGQEATMAQRAALEDALGLNQPIYLLDTGYRLITVSSKDIFVD